MSVPAAMAIGRSRFASLSSEPAKPTLFQASIEKSDPTIAAPMTGHSVAPKPLAGQNAGPKLAAVAAALRATEIGRGACRGRGEISVVAGSLKKKKRRMTIAQHARQTARYVRCADSTDVG